jgi:hypothetical protein
MLDDFFRNEVDNFLQKSKAERFNRLVSNDTAIDTNCFEGVIRDLIPSLVHSSKFEIDSTAIKLVVVRFEGTYRSHIKRRDEKGSFGSEIYRNEHSIAIWKFERVDELTDLRRGVRGQSIHAK